MTSVALNLGNEIPNALKQANSWPSEPFLTGPKSSSAPCDWCGERGFGLTAWVYAGGLAGCAGSTGQLLVLGERGNPPVVRPFLASSPSKQGYVHLQKPPVSVLSLSLGLSPFSLFNFFYPHFFFFFGLFFGNSPFSSPLHG